MKNKWYLELDAYIRSGEPDLAEKSRNWMIAIGLQQVDGLTVSDYLLDNAREHIEGHISISEVQQRISCYYNERSERVSIEKDNLSHSISSKSLLP